MSVSRGKKSGLVVQIMSLALTAKSKSQLSVRYNVMLKMRPSMEIDRLFGLPYDRCFSGLDGERNLNLFYYSVTSKGRISPHQIELATISKPFVNLDSTMHAGKH